MKEIYNQDINTDTITIKAILDILDTLNTSVQFIAESCATIIDKQNKQEKEINTLKKYLDIDKIESEKN